MLGSALSTVTGVLEQRFLRNAFFLVLAFTSLAIVVALAGVGELGAALASWGELPVATQLALVAAFLATVWLVAAIVDGQTRSIGRAFEGYWVGPLRPLRRYGEARHRARHQQFLAANKAEAIYATYPLNSKQVMATRLGNILRGAERYPLDRYGADAVVVWPRLYPLLPDPLVVALGQARAALEFLLVLSALAGLFGVLSAAYLLTVSASIWLFLSCLWGAVAVAFLTYAASLNTARVYAELMRSSFDVHRLELLPLVGLDRPRDATEELTRWEQFSRLVLQNVPLPGRYPPSGAGTSPTGASADGTNDGD